MLGIKFPLKIKVTTKYFENRVLHMKSNSSDFQKFVTHSKWDFTFSDIQNSF